MMQESGFVTPNPLLSFIPANLTVSEDKALPITLDGSPQTDG